jgi:hypothetical protein
LFYWCFALRVRINKAIVCVPSSLGGSTGRRLLPTRLGGHRVVSDDAGYSFQALESIRR